MNVEDRIAPWMKEAKTEELARSILRKKCVWRRSFGYETEQSIIEAMQNFAEQIIAAHVPQLERVTEIGICEIDNLILHPDQLYIFRIMEGCDKCQRYINPLKSKEEKS